MHSFCIFRIQTCHLTETTFLCAFLISRLKINFTFIVLSGEETILSDEAITQPFTNADMLVEPVCRELRLILEVHRGTVVRQDGLG